MAKQNMAPLNKPKITEVKKGYNLAKTSVA
jgi:hypothetical protein